MALFPLVASPGRPREGLDPEVRAEEVCERQRLHGAADQGADQADPQVQRERRQTASRPELVLVLVRAVVAHAAVALLLGRV